MGLEPTTSTLARSYSNQLSYYRIGYHSYFGYDLWMNDNSIVPPLAEREGFEPPRPFRACRFSKPVPSATRPPLQNLVAIHDLQPRPYCRLKLQRCRLFTLHERCYLSGMFSTFPIGSVCGEGGIRTPGGCYTPTVFKTAAINHSATSPNYKVHLFESNKIKPFYICCTNLYISSVIKITKKNFLLSLLTFVPPEGLEPPTR